MKLFLEILLNRSVYFKILLYINFMLLSIWGPFNGCVLIAFSGFIFLILYPEEKAFVANPFSILIFCILMVLITVLTQGTGNEIWDSVIFSTRLLSIFLISSIAGLIIQAPELIGFCKTLRLPSEITFLVTVLARFLPISVKNINAVILAQKSRGLSFGFKTIFNLQTYNSLVVPYIICTLRSAMLIKTSVKLRPIEKTITFLKPLKSIELIIFVLTLSVWFL